MPDRPDPPPPELFDAPSECKTAGDLAAWLDVVEAWKSNPSRPMQWDPDTQRLTMTLHDAVPAYDPWSPVVDQRLPGVITIADPEPSIDLGAVGSIAVGVRTHKV